jgi:copper transport protein
MRPSFSVLDHDLTVSSPRLHHSWRVLLLLLGCVLLLVAPIPAAAHSQLVSADPSPGQVLTAPPTEIRLTFSEQVALDFSAIQVLDRGRHRLDTGPVTQPNGDPLRLRVAVTPDLKSGVYTVVWRVVSAVDGHLTESRYAFTVLVAGEPTPTPGAEPTPPVIAPETGPPSAPEGNTPPPDPVRWGVRALALLLAAWLLGGPLFTVLVLEPALLAPGAPSAGTQLLTTLQRRWSRLGVGAAVGLLALLGTDMLFQVSTLTGGTPLEAFGQLDVLGRFVGSTSYGLYWALRVGAVLVLGLLCLGLARAVQADVTLWSIGVAAAGLIFAGEALSSHPAAAAPILGLPLGTLSDLIHLMATGAWVGGLLYFAVVLLPLLHTGTLTVETRGRMLARIVPRFSNIALISVGLLIVTGIVNLALHTLDPGAIVASNYGQVLILKHLLFLPLLALGAVQNRVIQPRVVALLAGDGGSGAATVGLFQRVIRGEVLLASAVLLCAGGLTLLPPPAQPGSSGLGMVMPTPVLGTPAPTATSGPLPPSPTPVVVTATQALGGLDVGLIVRPDLTGDHFTVRLSAVDATPLITNDLRLQLRITPQDVNAGSTLLPLTFAGSDGPALTYTATEPILTLAGGYDARVLVSRRTGNDVKVAFRLDLDENGGLTMRPAPFVQVAVSTDPSPAISGTVGIDLRLTDGVGQPVEGATVNLLPLMPAHAHIEPQSQAVPVPGTPGLYRTSATLQMGGGWLIIVDVNQPGQPPIRTDASFDVIDPNATPTPATNGGATPSP